ncbi:MAG: hypothetical protein RH942_05355 [Kiloniellaceae bacterium]
MKKTLTVFMVAAGVAGFASSAFAAGGCSYGQTAQSSKPVVTADAEQSTPVATTAAETAKN